MFVLPFAFDIASLQQPLEVEKSLGLGPETFLLLPVIQVRPWVNHFALWFHICKGGGIVILSACFPHRIVQRIMLGKESTFIIVIRPASP